VRRQREAARGEGEDRKREPGDPHRERALLRCSRGAGPERRARAGVDAVVDLDEAVREGTDLRLAGVGRRVRPLSPDFESEEARELAADLGLDLLARLGEQRRRDLSDLLRRHRPGGHDERLQGIVHLLSPSGTARPASRWSARLMIASRTGGDPGATSAPKGFGLVIRL